ncbi:MAG: DMT family transporter [Hyphomicrobiales bacterium]|nr:DMT family transporter [Hyphomicrobiales bacterium]
MTAHRSHKITNTVGAILAVIASTLLAITNIGAPSLYDAGSNPATILMLRAFVTAASIGLILLLTGKLHKLAARDEIYCIISGLLFMFVGFGLFTALAVSPVSTVILLLYVYPLLTTIIESVITRRLPDAKTVCLMLLALFGLGLALDVAATKLNLFGVSMALMAAIGVASTLVWNSHKLSHIDAEQITFRMFCVNSIVFLGYVLYLDNFQMPAGENSSLVLILLLVCFAFAFPAFFRAVQMAGPVRAAMIMNLEPVISIVLSVIILMEVISLSQTLGAILVIAAVVISQIVMRRSDAVPQT